MTQKKSIENHSEPSQEKTIGVLPIHGVDTPRQSKPECPYWLESINMGLSFMVRYNVLKQGFVL